MSIVEMGVSINGVHSYTDLGLMIREREITTPERQAVRATVPYMNGYYDFSSLNGGPYYGSRTLTYSFDLLADTPQEVEAIRNDVLSWAMTAQESKIYDDDDPNYYFVGSYDSESFDPDDDLPEYGGRQTIKFIAQPYRYNRETDEGVI
ncbi:MAG: hypothetical protein LUD78_00165 [Clostridiales bacterium]|nr:hypothetical protein [Clostridiales bacterium]